MTLDQLVEQLLADPGFRANVTAWRLNPAQEARYGPWPERLDPRLVEALGRRGIGRLYTHQSAAIKEHLLNLVLRHGLKHLQKGPPRLL